MKIATVVLGTRTSKQGFEGAERKLHTLLGLHTPRRVSKLKRAWGKVKHWRVWDNFEAILRSGVLNRCSGNFCSGNFVV